MGLSLSIAATALAFVLAWLGRFSSKDRPWHNRLFIVALIVNFLVALGSIWNASDGQSRQAKALSDLNDAQKQLITLQQDQLRIGNALAGKLTQAQETTEHISSELTKNTRVVGNVLHQTARALEPLGELGFLCDLEIPETDAETKNIVDLLEAGTRPEVVGDGAEARRYLLQPSPVSGGRIMLQSDPNYPKPNTALGSLLNSVQVLLQFYSKHWPSSSFANAKPPQPDLTTSISPSFQIGGMKFLLLKPDHTLVIELDGRVPAGTWGSTGIILSVKDLLEAEAVVQPIFSVAGVTGSQYQTALDKWTRITVKSLIMYTGDGRRWRFDTKSAQIVHPQGAPIFVGRFNGPVKPNSAEP